LKSLIHFDNIEGLGLRNNTKLFRIADDAMYTAQPLVPMQENFLFVGFHDSRSEFL